MSSGYEIRRAIPADAEGIAAAHADSIRSIGPQFYPPETVHAWDSGLASELYVKAMASGEVFWIAVGALAGGHEVLGFSSHRVDDNSCGVFVGPLAPVSISLPNSMLRTLGAMDMEWAVTGYPCADEDEGE